MFMIIRSFWRTSHTGTWTNGISQACPWVSTIKELNEPTNFDGGWHQQQRLRLRRNSPIYGLSQAQGLDLHEEN